MNASTVLVHASRMAQVGAGCSNRYATCTWAEHGSHIVTYSRPSIASWLPAVFTAAHDHPRTHSVHIQYDSITAEYILQSTS